MQHRVAPRVEGGIGMLPAIELYDDPALVTDEVDDVTEYRLLSPEFVPVELTIPEMVPDLGFHACLIAAQLPRDFGRISLTPHPSPLPSPRRGEGRGRDPR